MTSTILKNQKRYNTYTSFLKGQFPTRVQKVSLNTGFTCPNRDGSKGRGGCTYCNNNSFSPSYCIPKKSIREQLDDGIAVFSKKYPSQKYLAYFQSYTNTYSDMDTLKNYYTDALSHPDVVGMVIGTRPDCINQEVIDFLASLAKDTFISLDFGVESTLNRTLDRINRCHSFEETKGAFEMAKNKGFHLGAHMIMGLPGESREEMLNHAKELSNLPINSLKLHHLQIVKHTQMEKQFENTPEMFDLFMPDDYVDFVTEFITLLRPDIIIERFLSESPPSLLIAPKWGGIKNFEFATMIEKALLKKDLWQGKYFNKVPTRQRQYD